MAYVCLYMLVYYGFTMLYMQVYRIFTLPEAEDLSQLQVILENAVPLVRCAGFVYLRYVVPAAKLFDRLEEYLFDEMELKYQAPHVCIYTCVSLYATCIYLNKIRSVWNITIHI